MTAGSAATSQIPRVSARTPFTLGVEEELFLVDPAALSPMPYREGLASTARFRRGRITGEMCDGVVELISPVCDTAPEAVGTLAALRRDLLRSGEVAVLGVGVHPTQAFGDVSFRHSEHYDAVHRDTRSLLRQSAYCGMHVHVGMPDPETTIVAFNGMRKWIPVLQALGANSPYWHGQDSQLASSRTILAHSLPRTGLPRAFDGWADFHATAAELCRVAQVADGASFWWDMRPHHEFGTLEIRAIDTQSSLADAAAIAALAHCLVVHEAVTATSVDPPSEVLAEATFRAVRDGLDASLSVGGPLVAARDLVQHACDIASGYAPGLGCSAQLADVQRLLADGNGAIRQRRAYGAGAMAGVLRLLHEESNSGLDELQAVSVA